MSPKHHCRVWLTSALMCSAPTYPFAQQISEGTLAEVRVTGRAYVPEGGPATMGFTFTAQPDALRLQTSEYVLIESGLAGWDASGSLGLASSVQSRGFSVNPQASTGLSAGRILINGHPDVGRRFVRDPVTIEHTGRHRAH